MQKRLQVCTIFSQTNFLKFLSKLLNGLAVNSIYIRRKFVSEMNKKKKLQFHTSSSI